MIRSHLSTLVILLFLPLGLWSQEGISDVERNLEQAIQRGDQTVRDSLRLEVARLYLSKKDIPKALRFALEGKQSFQENNQSYLNTEFSILIADIYQQANLPSAAIPYFQEALAGWKNQWSQTHKAKIQMDLGGAYLASFQPDTALMWLNRAQAYPGLDRGNKDKLLQWKTQALEQTGRRKEAIMLTEERLADARNGNDQKRIASLNNNLGYLLHRDGQYVAAARRFKEALITFRPGDASTEKLALLTHLGIAEYNLGNTKASLTALQKAESLAPPAQKPAIRNLIAVVYKKSGDQYNALRYAELAATTAKNAKDAYTEAESFLTTAGIYTELAEYETALGYYQKHLSIRDSLRLEDRLQEQRLQEQELSLERSEKEIRLLLSAQELRDLTIQQLGLEKEKLQLESDNMSLEAARKEDELVLLRQQQEIQASRLANQALEAARANQELVLARQRLETERQDREITELNQREAMQQMEIAAQESREQENLQKISLLNQEKQIQDLTIQKQDAFRRSALGAGALLLIILGLIAGGYLLTRRKNKLLADQNEQIRRQNQEIEANRAVISAEKARSDALLLNILPAETAEELKATGKATPRKYEQVTVMFTDFSKFTTLTEHLDPKLLIDDLNTYFAAFDDIVSHHGLEKIKTIGDAYMCAGGLGDGTSDHALATVRAALEMQEFCVQQAQKQVKNGAPAFTMRVGIHAGPVVAGVVGSRKFAYDIWGDTVNTASRLESAGEPGKVNISKSVFDLLGNQFSCDHRGSLPVKNRADIEMYFVAGPQ